MPASKETMEGAEPGKQHAAVCPVSLENAIDMLEHQDPETPRPSASLEPTSQEENYEKQEQPSPVSVLDPFIHGNVDSPKNKSMMKCNIQLTESEIYA